MGVNIFNRTCTSSPYAAQDSNPNPSVFKILKSEVISNYLVLKVNYPDAKNYEGNKIMVFEGFTSFEALLVASKGQLDPHFSKSKISPVARFEPTKRGWDLACELAGFLSWENTR